MSPEAAVSVQGVSKRYEIYARPYDRLRQLLFPSQQYFKEFWALKDVSFTLQRGEVLGILGRNGAGKSTLLEIIAGTLSPSAGEVDRCGKVAALLELGSGFSPEFTGRENVRMNAALLGLSARELDARFDQIAAFAEIGEFMDQPVKTYSTGMVLRVAFAVQTAIRPEILIVDEALAVGDARFQKKCFERLNELRAAGTTILLVTHDSGTVVQFCTRAMILERGRIHAAGEPQLMSREYHKLLFGPPAAQPEALPRREVRYGSGEASIVRIGLRNRAGEDAHVIEAHEPCEAYFRAVFRHALPHPVAYGFIISNARGVEVYGTKSGLHGGALRAGAADQQFECRLRFVARLVPGRYFLSVALAHDDEAGQFLDYRFDALEFQVIGSTRAFTTSLVDLDATLAHLCIEPVHGNDRLPALREF
jgi:lipopolysaccharide transport system ATP-binding protein